MNTGLPGYCKKGIPVSRVLCQSSQKSQKFRVRVWGSCRTYSSCGYGYESVTELTEVPGIVAQAHRTHRSSGRVQKTTYPYPGYYGTGRTELTDVPGTGMNVIHNSQKFRVLWHLRTELTEVPGRYAYKNFVPVP